MTRPCFEVLPLSQIAGAVLMTPDLGHSRRRIRTPHLIGIRVSSRLRVGLMGGCTRYQFGNPGLAIPCDVTQTPGVLFIPYRPRLPETAFADPALLLPA
jgi:hypothetical protein